MTDVCICASPGPSRRARGAPDTDRRRHVAVLFADISGFTRLVESADPESVYEVVRPLMDELIRHVRRHGGEIQQILGDGFMAVFGLHERPGDEVHRALCAGLSLVAAAEDEDRPPVHVGIEYGEVLVTPSWEPASYAVWGRAVVLAKRLCDVAGPGTVQIGPAAFARHHGGARRAEPVVSQLKGITHATLSYRLSGEQRECA